MTVASDVVEVAISLVSGKTILISAPASSTVFDLKDIIEDEEDIDTFSQVLFQGSCRLSHSKILGELAAPGKRLSLSLLQAANPSCFSVEEVEDLWQAFLVHSTDSGDSLSAHYFQQVMRFTGNYVKDEHLREILGSAISLTFQDLLYRAAFWKQNLYEKPPSPSARKFEYLVQLLQRLDPENTGMVPRSAFMQAFENAMMYDPDLDEDDQDDEIIFDLEDTTMINWRELIHAM
eukprot:TRINITY_DN54519_c0_g1_i1.p1 TRINITY_DN54519_c0_g1~~TRINITY_DN54519_c0_g1_i1.p1  ORF type:complete len:234 (-),score=51.37 TRINITY_DN54519_c0_g1_i1:90-791(-)